MNSLAVKSVLAAVMTAAWFLPYISLIRPRLHRAVDGGLTGGLTVCTPMLSSALAVRLGWSPAGPDTLAGYSVQVATVVLVSAVLAGAATYFGGVRKQAVT